MKNQIRENPVYWPCVQNVMYAIPEAMITEMKTVRIESFLSNNFSSPSLVMVTPISGTTAWAPWPGAGPSTAAAGGTTAAAEDDDAEVDDEAAAAAAGMEAATVADGAGCGTDGAATALSFGFGAGASGTAASLNE